MSSKQPLFPLFYQRLIILICILTLGFAGLGVSGIAFFARWHIQHQAAYRVSAVKRLATPLLSPQANSAELGEQPLTAPPALMIDCQALQSLAAKQAITQQLQQLKSVLQVHVGLWLETTCVQGAQTKQKPLIHHTLSTSSEILLQNLQSLDFHKPLLSITLDAQPYRLGHIVIKDLHGTEAGRLLVFMAEPELAQAVYRLAIWASLGWLLLTLLLLSAATAYLWYLSQRVPTPLNTDYKNQLNKLRQELEASQQELLKVEKMAALGKLLAGVAHEINTPLGAIRSSVNHLNLFWKTVLNQLPTFFHNLSDSQQAQLVILLNLAISTKDPVSSRQERQNKRALRRTLEIAEITEAEAIAEQLCDMGVCHINEDILALLRSTTGIHILAMAHQLMDALHSTQTIHIAIEHAAKVVLALKSFTHYEQQTEKTTSNIIDGIEIVLTLYHNLIKQGIEVVRDYQEIPDVPCYPDELIQVWTNLIHNALQAMDNQTGTLSISTRRLDQQVSVSISDTGKGIPLELQEKIFQPFFTTKPSGEGSGMGLEIAQKIVQRHEGKIELQSAENQGCTFTVYLPLENKNSA